MQTANQICWAGKREGAKAPCEGTSNTLGMAWHQDTHMTFHAEDIVTHAYVIVSGLLEHSLPALQVLQGKSNGPGGLGGRGGCLGLGEGGGGDGLGGDGGRGGGEGGGGGTWVGLAAQVEQHSPVKDTTLYSTVSSDPVPKKRCSVLHSPWSAKHTERPFTSSYGMPMSMAVSDGWFRPACGCMDQAMLDSRPSSSSRPAKEERQVGSGGRQQAGRLQ